MSYSTGDDDTARRRVEQLYADFAANGLMPLWTGRGDLMPMAPEPGARAARVAMGRRPPARRARAGELVPVGRGGERRAIAYANPGLAGEPYATPTLWAAVQYLGPNEVAPAHRHSQSAFRFVLEGEGVWTVVDGDPVAMRRGDLLLTAGWRWHEHHNTADAPMVVARRPRHPARVRARRRVLRVRPRRGHRPLDAARLAQRAAVGPRRAPSGRRAGRRGRRR